MNDLIKLVNLLLALYKRFVAEREILKQRHFNDEQEREERIQAETELAYSLDLEEKLEIIHIKLLKAVVSSKSNSKRNKS